MLQRALIYTGITRAKNLGIMVGSEAALEKAVRNIDSQKRWSYLEHALREEFEQTDPKMAPVF